MSKVSDEAIKPKRGRRSKKEILASQEKEKNEENEKNNSIIFSQTSTNSSDANIQFKYSMN